MDVKLRLLEANLENLTTLWKTASRPFNAYFSNAEFEYCLLENSQWPNRLWFRQHVNPDTLEQASAVLCTNSGRLLLPYWERGGSKAYKLLEQRGFQPLFEQVAMSLKLGKTFLRPENLEIRLVSDAAAAAQWVKTFALAFGYHIGQEILMRTHQQIQYYVAYHQKQAIGTAMLFQTNGVAGIHAVGVIPDMRRKGFAEEIMLYLLQQATAGEAEYATLQASQMGKGIYLKLGFEEQLLIKTWALPTS